MRKYLAKAGDQLIRYSVPIVLMLAWHGLAVWIDKPMVLPRLDAVAAVLAQPATKILITGSLLENLAISLLRVMVGFTTAALLAVPLGLMMGYFRNGERFFDVMIEMLRPIPPLAWVPLVLAWFGIRGLTDWIPALSGSMIMASIQFSTIVIIVIGAFFPILLNTTQGVKNIPSEYLESARTLGACGIPLLFKVLIPASLPLMLTGLRIGLGIGWMCLVAAEMMPGSSSGLGYLIWYAYELLRADIIVAGMIVIGAIGFFMDRGFRWVERPVKWGNRL